MRPLPQELHFIYSFSETHGEHIAACPDFSNDSVNFCSGHKGHGQDGGYSVSSHIMYRMGEGDSSGG